MTANNNGSLGGIIKQQRISIPLTLHELAAKSGVSASYLGRIEMGQRFPSARILRKIAAPLGFDMNELFTLAGYLSPQFGTAEANPLDSGRRLDPYVARELAQEPVAVQRTVIKILTILKNIARNMTKARR